MKRLTRSPKERFFDSLIRIILILAAILTLFPFLYVVMISLLSPAEYMSRGLVFPLRPTLNNYAMLFKWGTKIQNAYLVTIGTTVVGTAISLSATALLAYGLSRPALPGKSFVNGMLVLTMFFSGGLIPTYMVIKIIGLMNTYWALILPGSLSVWNVMVMRTFFKELPVELEESAVLDGAKRRPCGVQHHVPAVQGVLCHHRAVLRGGLLEPVVQRDAVSKRFKNVSAANGPKRNHQYECRNGYGRHEDGWKDDG